MGERRGREERERRREEERGGERGERRERRGRREEEKGDQSCAKLNFNSSSSRSANTYRNVLMFL